jgi:hypothetical protein
MANQEKGGEFWREFANYREASAAYSALCVDGEAELGETAFFAETGKLTARMWQSGAQLANMATADPAHALALLRIGHDGVFNDGAMLWDGPNPAPHITISAADDGDHDTLERAMIEAAMRIIERHVAKRPASGNRV